MIQEHRARTLHWDVRLERDGVFVSWAVPKGLPTAKGVNHLAVHVEDHPLEYGGFEGVIPKGQYGAGTVAIWDRGTFEVLEWSGRKVEVCLHGRRVDGRYALFHTDGDRWMIHALDPPPDGWEPLPSLIRPMTAVAGDLPSPDRDWSFEFKWDGVRAVSYVEGGRIRILSRNDREVTAAYPELRALGTALGARPAVLDGEIVALDEAGRPSFEALQTRMHVGDAERARRLAAEVPVVLMVFDVLHLDGRSTLGTAYRERRQVLESLGLAGANWATPRAHPGPGADVLTAASGGGLEGVVAKRSDSPYRPGRRDPAWVKVKTGRMQEVVIGGWAAGRGGRSGDIGALVLGVPLPGGGRRLRYVGRVGTGFSDAALAELRARLTSLSRETSPFVDELTSAERSGVTWVAPRLVGEVRFAHWTKAGRLRHPIWRGLRPDKHPSEVVVEP